MARYREKIMPPAAAVLLLAFSFLIAFAPWMLGSRELSWTEGYLAAQAQGMQYLPLPVVTVHGEAIPNAFGLFPMLADALMQLGFSAETALRSLSLLGLAGCAVLVFIIAKRMRGLPEACCAAAMMLTTLLAIDKSTDGGNNWLFVLDIFGGHLAWYYFAAIRGNWSRAWLVALLACSVGFYLNGVMAPIFLFVPLVFMRRPLGIFRRLKEPGMALGLVIFALTVLLWYLPYRFDGVKVAAVYSRTGWLESWDYLWHIVTFPWDFGLRLFPWCLLAWAPFCVAFQTLDTAPIFSRFLRTLFITDFFLLWLTPVDEVHDWLILLPPAALMTGLYYEITIRRCGNFFRRLADFGAALTPFAGAVLTAFFLIDAETLHEVFTFSHSLAFSDRFGETLLGITAGIFIILLGVGLWRRREKPPIWSYWLMLSFVPLLFYHTLVQPYRQQTAERRQHGAMIAQAMLQDGAHAGDTLCKYECLDLFAEGVYSGMALTKLDTLGDLPQAEVPVVYLLSPAFPTATERSWHSLLAAPLKIRHGQSVNLWRGDWLGAEQPVRRLKPLVIPPAPPLPEKKP